MKKFWKWVPLALLMTLLCSNTALAAKGPGVAGETAGTGNTAVRMFPGWNGAGTIAPMISSSLDEEDNAPNDEAYTQGWRYSPSGWWYQFFDGGWPTNGWKYIDSRWYYFNSDGHVVTGWLRLNNQIFYLNPTDDGTYASLRTGWQLVDGKAYYLNAKSDGNLGALLTNTTTPDGYKVGADGVLIP